MKYSLAAGLAVASAIGGAMIASVLVVAGPLNPPAGAVSSTYKTLSEVEPRTAISAANTPGDADSVYRITQPGSYYLTSDVLAPAGKSAIEIASASAGEVAIDLNGFELRGTGTHYGVASNVGSRVWIRNGAIRNFGQSAVIAEGLHVLIEQLHVWDCGNPGIHAYGAGIVRDCDVESCGTAFDINGVFNIERCNAINNSGYGILAVGTNLIVDCAAVSNDAAGFACGATSVLRGCRSMGNSQEGISVGDGSTLIDCESTDNLVGVVAGDQVELSGVVCRSNVVGISAQANCTLRACTTIESSSAGVLLGARATVIDCVSSLNVGNSGDGFKAGANSTFTNCTAVGNSKDGFEAADGSAFTGCTSNDNGGRGIFAFNGAHITGCMTRNNQEDGIYVNFSCVVSGNNCNGDGAAAGNHGAIRVIGQANRIDSNNISYADRGLMISSGGNAVVRNSVKGCTVNFDIIGGNDVGPIGSAATATSPWANIQY